MEAMYRAKNGERPLYAMQASLPLEDFLHIDGLEKDMETSLDAVPEHLDCQIIEERKSFDTQRTTAKTDERAA